MRILLIASLLSLAIQTHGNEKTKGLLRSTSSLNATTDTYTHSWQSFPSITGHLVSDNSSTTIEAQRGKAIVAIFIASWCLPCQNLIRDIKSLEKKFHERHTEFVYIFAHDTQADARGFTKVYGIGNNALLANVKLMKDFKQPVLPSIYVADRQTWMIWRSLDVKRKDLANLDEFLEYHTAN